jgi:hypothetical protein
MLNRAAKKELLVVFILSIIAAVCWVIVSVYQKSKKDCMEACKSKILDTMINENTSPEEITAKISHIDELCKKECD